MTNFERFAEEFRRQLEIAMREHPEDYMRGVTASVIADRMIEAFKARTYNKDGRAVRATCKVLGVKHTYRDINAFLSS